MKVDIRHRDDTGDNSSRTVAVREGLVEALGRPRVPQVPGVALTQFIGLVFLFYHAATNSRGQTCALPSQPITRTIRIDWERSRHQVHARMHAWYLSPQVVLQTRGHSGLGLSFISESG